MARKLQDQELRDLFQENLPPVPIPPALAISMRQRVMAQVNTAEVNTEARASSEEAAESAGPTPVEPVGVFAPQGQRNRRMDERKLRLPWLAALGQRIRSVHLTGSMFVAATTVAALTIFVVMLPRLLPGIINPGPDANVSLETLPILEPLVPTSSLLSAQAIIGGAPARVIRGQSGRPEFVSATETILLAPGDSLITESGTAEIVYFAGQTSSMDQGTEIRLDTLEQANGGTQVVVQVTSGNTRHMVADGLSAPDRFEIETSTMTASAVGADFSVNLSAGDATLLTAYEGAVVVTRSEDGTMTEVSGGEQLAVAVDGALVVQPQETTEQIAMAVAPSSAATTTTTTTSESESTALVPGDSNAADPISRVTMESMDSEGGAPGFLTRTPTPQPSRRSTRQPTSRPATTRQPTTRQPTRAATPESIAMVTIDPIIDFTAGTLPTPTRTAITAPTLRPGQTSAPTRTPVSPPLNSFDGTGTVQATGSAPTATPTARAITSTATPTARAIMSTAMPTQMAGPTVRTTPTRTTAPTATSTSSPPSVLLSLPTAMPTSTTTHTSTPAATATPIPSSTPTNSPMPTVAVNRLPIAQRDDLSTQEEVGISIPVLINDSDPDGDSLSIIAVGTPLHGSATVNEIGSGVFYTPTADFAGLDSFTYSITDGGLTATATVTVLVSPVNDAPFFGLSEALPTTNEDAGMQIIPGRATGISMGAPNETSQALRFELSVDNEAFFSTLPAIDPASGDLRFTSATNVFGTAQVTVVLVDDGGTLNGGQDRSLPQTFAITVAPVNDAPSFVLQKQAVSVNEDAGAHREASLVTAISAGASYEAAQTLRFETTVDNGALFSTPPAIDPVSGDLTFTPATNANGSTQVTVVLVDDGGTLNGGQDRSPPQTFTISVNPVNDAPSFALRTLVVSANEDGGLRTEHGMATAISAGPNGESRDGLHFDVTVDNAALFSVQPVIDPMNGDLTFTPAPDAYGTAQVTVWLVDGGGTLNGGLNQSPPQTFDIIVNQVNDPPSFALRDSQSTVSGPGPQTVSGLAISISAGPNGESSAGLWFEVTTDNGALFSTLPAMDVASGDLTFVTAADVFGTAKVTIVLIDGGQDRSPPQTYDIMVSPVNNVPTLEGGSVGPEPNPGN